MIALADELLLIPADFELLVACIGRPYAPNALAIAEVESRLRAHGKMLKKVVSRRTGILLCAHIEDEE